jgi:GTP-binding protein
MQPLPVVAIIGQTNAGKSSLFNRLVRRREAIVAREEGTTRDNVVARVNDTYVLVDTAGLKDPNDAFETSIRDQIEDAIASADLILLTLDSSKHTNHDDKLIAKKALKSNKPVILVLNKTDLGESLPETEFISLGIKDILRVSATTGQGADDLRSAIEKNLNLTFREAVEEGRSAPLLPAERSDLRPVKTGAHAKCLPEKLGSDFIKLALIGRPNVGKSSLFNTLAKKQQALVSSQQGTTRDINRVQIKYKDKALEILDTAGLRKPGKREVGVEKFSALRTLAAIEESDICCLLIDATEPHSKLDQALAGQIIDAGKGIILVVTKTDLLNQDRDHILNQLETDFNFIPYAPVILTSSQTGQNTTKIFELATKIHQERNATLKTSNLNKILSKAISDHPPAGLKNTMPKLRYITQTDVSPPWFVVYGSNLELLHWSYKRYLERKIRETHPFIGTPIKFSFKNRD